MKYDRRTFLGNAAIGLGSLYLFPSELLAADPCAIEHPFMPAKKDLPGECHNCGMGRPMWARTFHFYEVNGEKKEVCSLHCLAEATVNSSEEPQNVQVALYQDPYQTVPALSAYYVVGSKASGTMTMKSKLAFASQMEAEKFAGQCGGMVVSFDKALSMAKASYLKENEKIAQNRLKKGKIVEPEAADQCPVCKMYPARYARNKCQIRTTDKKVVHFCSTHCLFEYLKNSTAYSETKSKPAHIWVIDYDTGSWIYGKNAFYVVGSSEAGPMGKEAFPFMNKDTAATFAAANQGKVLFFSKVTIDAIKA